MVPIARYTGNTGGWHTEHMTRAAGKAPRLWVSARVVALAGVALAVVALFIVVVSFDRSAGFPDCKSGVPAGSKPCRHPCASPTGRCLYDPTGKASTSTTLPQYPLPPTTAPGSNLPPPAPPSAAN